MTNKRAAKIILDLINAGEAEYRNFSVEEIIAFKKAYVALNPEPVTNADRIRVMSDEELATLLTDVAKKFAEKLCESLKMVDVDISNYYFDTLYKVHLDWLKKEVD